MKMTNTGALIVVVFSLFVLFDAISRDEAQRALTKPYVSWSGSESAIKTRCALLAASEKEWTDIWLRHKGVKEKWTGIYDTFYNPAALPDVNFAECMIIALFEGESSNSAGLVVCEIEESEKELHIRYENKSYQTMGPDGGGRKAAPFGLFVVPKSEKTVIIEEKVRRLKNSPPLWKERARIEMGQLDIFIDLIPRSLPPSRGKDPA